MGKPCESGFPTYYATFGGTTGEVTCMVLCCVRETIHEPPKDFRFFVRVMDSLGCLWLCRVPCPIPVGVFVRVTGAKIEEIVQVPS